MEILLGPILLFILAVSYVWVNAAYRSGWQNGYQRGVIDASERARYDCEEGLPEKTRGFEKVIHDR